MKKLLLTLALLPALFTNAQEHFCAKAKRNSAAALIKAQAREATLSPYISHELEYDVKFVHLKLNLERNTTYISGGVTTVAKVTAAAMDTFMTILHQNHAIDSIRFNGVLLTAMRKDSMVKVKTPVQLPAGSSFTVSIYYKGTPPVGGSAIGSGFDSDVAMPWNSEVTWSLSEPFVAYHWWPCKQILTDKIDSSWVYVTTDSANKVGSNGLLKNVVALGAKKRYEWKSRTPINYYLISVAVAKYHEYRFYAKPQYLVNDSILVQNYIYENAWNNPNWVGTEKSQLDKLPNVIKLYSNLYGMYPFWREKYGHSMADFGGAQEHQTMTSTIGFEYYIDAHELGHQWWGDNVTCKSWNDIMMNEGFAVYSEYLTSWYLDNFNFQSKLANDHSYIMSSPGGSCYFTDTMNVNKIFDGRLTYAKGGSIIRSLQFVTNNDSLWFNTLRGFQNMYKNGNASVKEFKAYYETQTGNNATQFFDQWYYGEGYPTFAVRYNVINNTFILKSTQSVSAASVTPLFITPMEYKISRMGMPDTTIRVMHTTTTEIYSFPLTGTVTTVRCDPNNWIINKAQGPSLDPSLNTGIPTLSNAALEMSIGPNPGRGVFTLHNPARVSGKVSVWDLSGKLILEKKLEDETQINLGLYAHGLYETRVFNEDGQEVFSRKLVNE